MISGKTLVIVCENENLTHYRTDQNYGDDPVEFAKDLIGALVENDEKNYPPDKRLNPGKVLDAAVCDHQLLLVSGTTREDLAIVDGVVVNAKAKEILNDETK